MEKILTLYNSFGPWIGLVLPIGAVAAVLIGWCVGLGKKAGEAFAQEFGKVFGKSAAEWIRDNSAPFKIRYLSYLSDLVRHVDLKGFAQDTPFALELIDVFVDLSLDSQSLRNITSAAIRPLPESLAKGRHSIWEYLEQPGQRLAVIGAPGSGKTTLLKHMILAGCKPFKLKVHKVARSFLPVFIEIRKHAKTIGEKPDYGLADAVLDQLGGFGKRATRSWFDSKLDSGGCVVLIDGLDEVADPKLRQTVVNWVEKQTADYSKNRYVLTSRPNGYRNNPIQGFNTLEVQSFAPQDVRRFVHAWYLATEVAHHNRENTPAIRAKAEAGANGLLGKLRQSADLSDLASNPLLLTMISTVHRYRGSLPGSRVELYSDIASVFLGRRRQARELDFDLRPDQKQSVLEPLAYQMMLRRVKEISQPEVCSLIEKPLSEVRPNTSPTEFIQDIESTSGLFVERESGVWGFAHLTIQEYLAAVHIRSKGLDSRLAERVHEPWWHETVRLYVAQTDATAIIEACLAKNPANTESLVLAIQCVEEAKKVDSASRQRFQELLSNSVESPDAETRRPIAEALLHLRLAKMEALDENRFFSDFITHAEYQLFLDDLRAKEEYRQPDHWIAYEFPAGTGNKAVTGVRASDAVAFAKWLSERSDHGFKFRVPAENSAGIEQATLDSPGFWVETHAGFRIVNPSARAIFDRNRVLDLEFDRTPAFQLVRDRARDFALDRALDLDLDLALDLALDLDLDLDLALDLARELQRIKIFKSVNFAELIKQLEALQSQVPDRNQPIKVRRAFFQRLQQLWFDALQLDSAVAELDKAESTALATYFTAQLLMVRCQQSAVRVSPQVWAAIEVRMVTVIDG